MIGQKFILVKNRTVNTVKNIETVDGVKAGLLVVGYKLVELGYATASGVGDYTIKVVGVVEVAIGLLAVIVSMKL